MKDTTKIELRNHAQSEEDYNAGFITAIADLVRNHDQQFIAANIAKCNGLQKIDCSKIDEYDKIELRKLNSNEGLSFIGL